LNETTPNNRPGFDDLVQLVATLRSEHGCPWDREQTLGDLAKYLIEEAYELIDAVTDDETDSIEEEVGDLLFLVLFFAQIGREEDRFDISGAIARTYEKMVRRHPHVFGEANARNADEVLTHWYGIKAREGRAKAREKRAGEKSDDGGSPSAIGNIPRHLPALLKAQKIQRNVARVGFDWGKAEQVLDKADEELAELREALAGGDREAVVDELGDLLFSIANSARFLTIESEEALEQTNRKFIRRFQQMERKLTASGRPLTDYTLEEMDAEWERIKLGERAAESGPASDRS
jgi:tetrapyrrole methylase family protein/MazG family protein